MTLDPKSLLPRFGLTDFRPGQQDVVDALSAGKDVMCVMPTGGGKSLCYQLPSLAREGTTIVVSPLIALMKDQVDSLRELGINAKLINSSLSGSEQQEVMNETARGGIDLLYVAPERLRNSRFLDSISNAKISLLAIDEAHCVSEWGHDFRPDYARLGKFREKYLSGVQTIALTATATPLVRDDVCGLLALKSPSVFVTGFARTNLHFSVSHSKSDRSKDEQLLGFLKQQDGAGIIYASTRKRCEELADWLPEKAKRSIGMYHGGMDPSARKRVQEAFMSGKLSAIIATNAFGMGIDKSDIRFVVHYNMPGSLEAYYQEAGRAGRDSKESDCLLLFAYSDRYVQEFFIENRYPSKDTIRKVYHYLQSRTEDPIELTLDQIRDAINVKDSSESIGAAQAVLAKAGVLKRLDSASNNAIVRIDSDVPTLQDFLPKEAKIRSRVIRAVEKVIGKRRGEDVYVSLKRLMDLAEVDRTQLARTMRELSKLRAFDYVPPFRGRAVHLIQRDVPFEKLDIDFKDLNRRKAAEHEKLEAVISFARTNGCRQRVILDYFGDPNSSDCGKCDHCEPAGAAKAKAGNQVSLSSDLKGVDATALLCGIRVVLSGVTRMHGRFGKNLVAQMLCGSKSKKLQQWKLNRLSTYGMLSALRQSEVVTVMDALAESGLLVQREVDERRPTIHITDFGKEVMHAREPLPPAVHLTLPMAKRLAVAAKGLESGDVPSDANGSDPSTSKDDDSDSSPENDRQELIAMELADRLKSWRRKTAAALGIPAFRVLGNATLDRVVEMLPQSSGELEAISGVGPATMEQFGHDILEMVREVTSKENPTGNADEENDRVELSVNETSQPESNNDSQLDPDPAAGETPAKVIDALSAMIETVEADNQSTQKKELLLEGDEPATNSHPADPRLEDPRPVIEEITLRSDPASTAIPAPHMKPTSKGPAPKERASEELNSKALPSKENSPPQPVEIEPDGLADPSSGSAVADTGLQPSDPPPPDVVPDCYWTWRLFNDGYSADQVMQIRCRSVGAIIQDLAEAKAAGYEIQPDWQPAIGW
ncbi:RecQ family ATP-dependent DNA helicase [Planctomycetes bacterium K23_9]|uniref:ATP-dependent DNA helicase RecQ n=1 Tax=Stieleria marina TaxID=1930275 RepID=A0A517NN39_9BACT|nr:ATP-dependent DNA helicase RecQ [Planctomycetes bacterium K23_9]